jgi:tetratricopeptide (TPR) repeat protein
MDPSLGDRIKQLRHAAGLSQEELGAGLVTGSYISLIEAGKRAPVPEVLVGLAQRLGTTTEYLLTGDSEHAHQEDQLRLKFAELALTHGDADEAYEGFLALADRPRPELRRAALWGLARAAELRGSHREAATILEQLLGPARASEPGAPPLIRVHMARCRVYREAGDLTRSVEVGERALAEIEKLGLAGTEDEIKLASTLVAAYWGRGDLLSAEVLAGQVIERAERLDSREALGSALWNACLVAEARGEMTLALSLAERTIALIAEGPSPTALAGMRVTYGWLLLRCDPPRLGDAEEQLRRAHATLADSSGKGPDMQCCDTELARAAMLRGDLETALQFADHALGMDLDAFPNQDALFVRGLVLTRMGRTEEGLAAVEGAARHLEGIGSQLRAARAWREYAETLLQFGDRDGAVSALVRAADCAGIRSAMAASPLTDGQRRGGDHQPAAAPGG